MNKIGSFLVGASGVTFHTAVTAPSFIGAAIIPILLFIDIILVFLTIFLIKKLKNKLGIYICWIPSFVSLIVWIVLLATHQTTEGLVVLFIVFMPYFISYTLCAILKIRKDNLAAKKDSKQKRRA